MGHHVTSLEEIEHIGSVPDIQKTKKRRANKHNGKQQVSVVEQLMLSLEPYLPAAGALPGGLNMIRGIRGHDGGRFASSELRRHGGSTEERTLTLSVRSPPAV